MLHEYSRKDERMGKRPYIFFNDVPFYVLSVETTDDTITFTTGYQPVFFNKFRVSGEAVSFRFDDLKELKQFAYCNKTHIIDDVSGVSKWGLTSTVTLKPFLVT